jgi:hypothetical protein
MTTTIMVTSAAVVPVMTPTPGTGSVAINLVSTDPTTKAPVAGSFTYSALNNNCEPSTHRRVQSVYCPPPHHRAESLREPSTAG